MVPPGEITEDFRRALESLNRLIENEVLMASLTVIQRQTLRLITSQTDSNHLVAELQEKAAKEA